MADLEQIEEENMLMVKEIPEEPAMATVKLTFRFLLNNSTVTRNEAETSRMENLPTDPHRGKRSLDALAAFQDDYPVNLDLLFDKDDNDSTEIDPGLLILLFMMLVHLWPWICWPGKRKLPNEPSLERCVKQ